MRSEGTSNRSRPPWCDTRIRIDPADEFTHCDVEPGITCMNNALTRFYKISNSRIPLLERTRDFRGAVGGIVVDNNYLEDFVPLTSEGLQTPGDVVLLVVHGNHH